MNLNDCEADLGRLEAHLTADGSFSLHSSQFGEAFHNSAGAINEANAKYVVPAQLERFQSEANIEHGDRLLRLEAFELRHQ